VVQAQIADGRVGQGAVAKLSPEGGEIAQHDLDLLAAVKLLTSDVPAPGGDFHGFMQTS
jgi:hypothetical protein